jgi:mannose-6-phosphate isomerase-like protein (cupin superfamily)
MGYGQMLRVSKVDDWLNRQPTRRDLRSSDDCVIIRSAGAPRAGANAVSAGARALGVNLVMIPPGSRGMPHYHDGRETALYLVSGETEVWYGAGPATSSTSRRALRTWRSTAATSRRSRWWPRAIRPMTPTRSWSSCRGTWPACSACRSRCRNDPTTPPRAPPAGAARRTRPVSGGSSSAAGTHGASLPPPAGLAATGRGGPRWCSSGGRGPMRMHGADARGAGEHAAGARSAGVVPMRSGADALLAVIRLCYSNASGDGQAQTRLRSP